MRGYVPPKNDFLVVLNQESSILTYIQRSEGALFFYIIKFLPYIILSQHATGRSNNNMVELTVFLAQKDFLRYIDSIYQKYLPHMGQ